jgi:hypothetical protein
LIQTVNSVAGNGFLAPAFWSAGTNAAAAYVAVADIDGDGKPDLVVAGELCYCISILLGNGDGTFQSPLFAGMPNSWLPSSVAVGDFNGDGKPDLVVGSTQSSGLYILLGNGDGTFSAAENWAEGFSGPVAVADVNGDGKLDVVTSGFGFIGIYLGGGDGSLLFSGELGYYATSAPVAFGDFNGDGKIDIAVTSQLTLNTLLGNGDGTFQTALVSSVYGGDSVAVADFNSDGKLDIATAGGDASVALGNGDGTFQPATVYGTGYSVATGDFNGDGNTDLVIVEGPANTLSILLGNGDGTFQKPESFGSGGDAASVAVADLNRDGTADLVMAETNTAAVMLAPFGFSTSTALSSSQGSSTYGQGVTLTATVYPSSATGMVTFQNGATVLGTAALSNGMAAITVYALPAGTQTVTASYAGNGTYGPSTTGPITQTVTVATSSTSIASSANPSAMNQAITLTAAVLPSVATGTVTFLNGTSAVGSAPLIGGNAALTLSTLPAGLNALSALYSGDTNDLPSTAPQLAQNVTGAGPVTGIILSSSANPSSLGQKVTFTASVFPVSAGGFVTFYDGTTPLETEPVAAGQALFSTTLLAAQTRSIRAYYGGGPDAPSTSATISQLVNPRVDTGFTILASPIPYGLDAYFGAVAGDFNLDGKPDIAFNGDNGACVALGNGDGTFQISQPPSPTCNYDVNGVGIATADFNGDGKPDLALANFGLGDLVIMLGNGDGTFQTPVSYPDAQGNQPGPIVVGDFNGDGRADLAIGNTTNVSVFLGNGDGTFEAAVPYPVAGASSIVVGDFNGDGKSDLAVAIAGDGSVTILLGNGDGTFQAGTSYPAGSVSYFITAGDFNLDGKTDLAILDHHQGNVYILLGNGDGTFQPAVPYSAGGAPFITSAAVLDFNSDGKPDLAVAVPESPDLSILIGNGDGTFQPAVLYPSGMGEYGYYSPSLVVADFNLDGATDVDSGVMWLGIGKASTTTTLTSSLNPAAFGQSVTLTVTVSPKTATGTVTFSNGTLLGTVNLSGGVAELTTSSLPAGALTLTAAYSGDSGDALSSASLNQTILPACLPNQTSITTDSNAYSGSIALAAGTLCAWSLSTNQSWISLVQTDSGYSVSISANATGADRAGSISFNVEGQGLLVLPVTQAFTAQAFSDVPPTAYYFDAVNLLYAKGITSGCSASPLDYCPGEDIPRDQMAIFLVRSVLGTVPSSSVPQIFVDVPPGSFAYDAIQDLYELAITTGCGSNAQGALLFCPTESVTRDQMAVFIIRARYGASTLFTVDPAPLFADVPWNYWAFDWIQRMKEDNITSGCTVTTYCPGNPVTRGDMAIFVMRGGFNQLLPLSEPVIASISPNTLTHGTTGTFTVTGLNTNFLQGTTTVVPPVNSGVTVDSVTVTSPTSVQVSLTAATNALLQPMSIYVQTEPEEAVLPNGLTVQ